MVLDVYGTIANNLEQTQDQLTSNIRFYCDEDKFEGDGARWIKTPDQPGDPIYAQNHNLQREYKVGDPPGTAYQMWQDEQNWVRMSRGSTGCQGKGTRAETQGVWWNPDQAPKGIAEPRCTITVSPHFCNIALLNVHSYVIVSSTTWKTVSKTRFSMQSTFRLSRATSRKKFHDSMAVLCTPK